MESVTLTFSEIEAWSRELSKKFQNRQIVLLEGTLGAGKTQLVKTLVRQLGGSESSSPTYSLINEYQLKDSLAYHVDLYRIKGEEDLESVGFWDLFEAEKAILFIEWPSRLKLSHLPMDWNCLTVTISKIEECDDIRKYVLS